MKAIKIWVMISVSGILIAEGAHASFPPPKGWYVEGSVGNTSQTNTSYGAGTSTTTKNAGFGLNANVGYKFFPYFALEAGYTRYSRIDIEFNNTVVAKNSPSAWDITTKTILPIQDSGFSFYAKIGVSRLTSSMVICDQATIDANGLSISNGDTSATGLLYGIGGEYFIWGNTALHLSWVEMNGNNQTGDMALISLGVSHVFG